MLARVTGQAPQIRDQYAALTLGQTEVPEAPDHGGHKGAALGFVGGNGEGDLGGACQEFPDLLDRLSLDSFRSITMGR